MTAKKRPLNLAAGEAETKFNSCLQNMPTKPSCQQIPKEIIEYPHWIVWKAKPKNNGKIDKIPFSPTTGKMASVSDKRTWSTFDEAVSKYKAEGFSGIGFVFTQDDPYCGVDLDKCRDPKTGSIAPWAEQIIENFQSYPEVSPSNTGVHIITKGDLLEGGRKKGNIEIYDKGRFFTFTGNHLKCTPKDIRVAQSAIDALLTKYFKKEDVARASIPCSLPQATESDSELIQKALSSRNGHKFELLYKGCWQEAGYPSQSEADQAFCNLLAFWFAKDAGRMDAIFRQSGLMRPKWDKKHYGDGRTYGQATIERAVASCHETYTGERTLQATKTPPDQESRIDKSHSGSNRPAPVETPDDPGETDADAELWEMAKELLPSVDFPEILPSDLNDSLAQLARSIGMPARSLPGVCMAAVGAAIGDRISVSPKQSWCEPLIFWSFDIRPSGEGKTPAMQALVKFFHHKQKIEHDYYDIQKTEFDKLPAKDRRVTPPPPKPRGFLSNSLTVEGLRSDLETNKTGGTLIALTEASTLISSQNEYKSKGSDRETWITLHDGDPIRILRAGKSIYISNSRVQITGGIQPGVFRKIFNSEDGIFLVDGTVFRGLYTYDGEGAFDIDDESWSEDAENVWTTILERAFAYSDKQESTHRQSLDKEAKFLFFSWRNALYRQKPFLPEKIRGFIPKACGYALRLAGVLHCIHKFHEGLEPTAIITREDMQRGIDGIMFYLGQAVGVVRLLAGEDRVSVEITEQTLHLAKTLKSLKPKLDSGRLAVGYIHEKFNETCQVEQKIKCEKAMGALLRKCKLTIPSGWFNANSRRGVKCLQWDEKTNSFIETRPPCPPCPPSEEYQGLQPADIEKLKSAKSAGIDTQDSKKRTLRTLKKQSPQPETGSSTGKADMADIADEFSNKNKKPDEQEFENLGTGCSDNVDDGDANPEQAVIDLW